MRDLNSFQEGRQYESFLRIIGNRKKSIETILSIIDGPLNSEQMELLGESLSIIRSEVNSAYEQCTRFNALYCGDDRRLLKENSIIQYKKYEEFGQSLNKLNMKLQNQK